VPGPLAYLNGEFLPRSSATLSVEDRGFVFGDGVYEVWRVLGGQPFELDAHLARLKFGLGELRITPPDIAESDMFSNVAKRLLGASSLETGEATIYLEITRGAAPRTHQFPLTPTRPTVFAVANRFEPPEPLRARGARAITMPDVRWLRCDIKTIQLLPNVLAKQTAVEQGATEAIFIRDGVVTEGSHTNLFGVERGVIRTHPANNLILGGVTRSVVIDIARSLGIEVDETPIAGDRIGGLDEAFLVGTTTDVMPLVRVDEHTVGSGAPGPIAKQLQLALRERLDAIGGERRSPATIAS
jgi:D-alanine transaminase